MALRFKFIGRKEFQREMATAGRKLPTVIERQLLKAGEVVIGEAKKAFSTGNRTSAKYKRGGGRRVRRVPPLPVTAQAGKLAIFEGNYRRSITQDLRKRGRSFETEIGPVGIKYARIHEFGGSAMAWGKHPFRMPKRPVLEPAIRKSEKRVLAILGRSFRIVLR